MRGMIVPLLDAYWVAALRYVKKSPTTPIKETHFTPKEIYSAKEPQITHQRDLYHSKRDLLTRWPRSAFCPSRRRLRGVSSSSRTCTVCSASPTQCTWRTRCTAPRLLPRARYSRVCFPQALNPQPSTLNPQPTSSNPQPSIVNCQPSTVNPKSQCANMLDSHLCSPGALRTRCACAPRGATRWPGAGARPEPRRAAS